MKRPHGMPFNVYKEKLTEANKNLKKYLKGRTIFNNGTLIGSASSIK